MRYHTVAKYAACMSSILALAVAGNAQESGTEDMFQLEEIIVTATRRAERLQDVPVAVAALSGKQLAANGFQSLQDIQYQMAGVQFGQSPNDSGFRLRGVGSAGGFSSSSEQNVGTVVDNVVVPFGNPVASLGDLERVEVLRGPQGTQFGKNASSGVVNITTKKPDPSDFSGKVFASYGELDERNVNAFINAPVSDTSAVSLYVFDRAYDGFLENVVRDEMWGGEESYGARGKFYSEPNEKFSLYLIADYSKIDREGPTQLWSINKLPSFANPLMAARFGSLAGLGITAGFENDQSAEDYEGYTSESNYGASLELNYQLDNYTVTSVTAYRALNQGQAIFSIDASPVSIFTAQQSGVDQSFLSEELRISSAGDSAFHYTAGVYLSRLKVGDDDTSSSAQLRPAAPFNPSVIVSISNGLSNTQTLSESAAAFIDGSYDISEAFSLIGGFRYQYDWVKAESSSEFDPDWLPFTQGGPVVPYAPRALEEGSTKKGDWSGRGGFQYRASDDVLLFASIARGYLGPTVTFSGLTGTKTEVAPQTVRDITIGAKTQWMDRRVTLNANIFFDSYKDLQTSVFNGLEFLTENAGGFTANGFEMDGSVQVSQNLRVNASFTYSDTEFTDYITDCPNYILAQGAAAIAATCNAPGSSADTALFQAAGEPLSGAPKYSATFGFDYSRNLSENLVLDVAANYYYRSTVQYDVGDPDAALPAYNTVGLNIGVGDADGQWRIAAFARNLFDERFHSAIIGLPFADPGAYVNWTTREGRRTLGVSAEFNF